MWSKAIEKLQRLKSSLVEKYDSQRSQLKENMESDQDINRAHSVDIGEINSRFTFSLQTLLK